MNWIEATEFLKSKNWIATGHWDNWFHPVSGWNYSLWDAVKCQQEEDKKSLDIGTLKK